MGDQLQDLISVYIARELVLEMITVVEHSFGAQSVQMSSMMHDRLRDNVQEFQTRVNYEDHDLSTTIGLLQAMEQIGRYARGRLPSGIASGHTPRNPT